MHSIINHAKLGLLHVLFYWITLVVLAFPESFAITTWAQPSSTLTSQEWTPGNPVTDESVEAGLRQSREALRSSSAFRSDDEETHLRLGTLLSQQGDPNGAIEEYRDVIRLAPGLAEAYRNLGSVLIDKHEWSEAVEALQTGVRLNNQDGQGYYWLGRAFLALRRYTDAIQAFLNSSRLQPNEPETWSDLALSYMAKGQASEAEATIYQAIQLRPDFAEAHQRLETVRRHRADTRRLGHATHELLSILFRRE